MAEDKAKLLAAKAFLLVRDHAGAGLLEMFADLLKRHVPDDCAAVVIAPPDSSGLRIEVMPAIGDGAKVQTYAAAEVLRMLNGS